MGMHTLSKQMGTSVRMLEAHYSKLAATMAAEQLALISNVFIVDYDVPFVVPT